MKSSLIPRHARALPASRIAPTAFLRELYDWMLATCACIAAAEGAREPR
jgi:hypothetical protein